MIDPSKIIILILGTRDKNYDDFIKVCKSTWIKEAELNSIRCYIYEGDSDKEYLNDGTIYLKVDDSLASTGLKLIRALNFLKTNNINYDYIFRTNLSSYIFVNSFLEFMRNNENQDLYAGFIGSYNNHFSFKSELLNKLLLKVSGFNPLKFASGSGFFISRNVAEKITNDRYLKFNLIDDVMIGECINRYNIPVKNVSRIELNDERMILSRDITNEFKLKNCFHVRLKSKDRSKDVNRFEILKKYNNFPIDSLEELGILRVHSKRKFYS